MRRTLSCSLVVLVLATHAAPASGEPPSGLTAAVARTTGAHSLGPNASLSLAPVAQPRRTHRKPSARRAVLTGFLVGAVVGGAVAYREFGAEGVWYGVYTLGIPCALVGWTVSR